MARPSPRTQGVDEEGKTFQKFGTQQLRFVAPPKLGTPYQGVVEKILEMLIGLVNFMEELNQLYFLRDFKLE